MKWTKKKIFYTVMETIFIGIVPLVLILLEYSTIADTKASIGFKISFIGIILLLISFYIIKNVLLKKWLGRLSGEITQHEADLKIKNDAGEIANLERELKRGKTIEVIINAIMPTALLVAIYIMADAMEKSIIRLSGIVGLYGLCFAIGTIFSILNAREVVGKNREAECGKD